MSRMPEETFRRPSGDKTLHAGVYRSASAGDPPLGPILDLALKGLSKIQVQVLDVLQGLDSPVGAGWIGDQVWNKAPGRVGRPAVKVLLGLERRSLVERVFWPGMGWVITQRGRDALALAKAFKA